MSEFLFEIGLEEIPARMIAGAQAELERRTVALLERERLLPAGTASRSFSTPRRLAVWIAEVADRQQDIIEDLLGPSAKIAYKDGVPTPAAIAFARKSGVAIDDLKTVTTPRGEYLQATSTRPGRTAAEVLAAELPKELTALYWAKTMYWRAGRPERFVRPVRWLLALLGHAVVPIEFAGHTAANLTYGHRILFGPQAIVITDPSAYRQALADAFVVADVELRRHTIRKALDHATRTVQGLRWREDHALIDSLTHLTEWASDNAVVLGSFEPEYLALPEEVLVTVMRDHQKYLALEDATGKLAPCFLAVLNTQADAAGLDVIRHGNARVLRARFNDARFFWEFDQRTPLTARVELLKSVTFQKDLGSYAAKTERVRKVAASLARLLQQRGVAIDLVALDEAATLAKTDLTCELVKEFTELQGIIGGLYARAQGFSETIALAIYDQYLPESMDDAIPRTIEGAILAIADKTDTIAGMFSLGLEPTGSKDPFALRRAANGIVKILAEVEPALPLTISEVATQSVADRVVSQKLRSFFTERLEFYLRETRSQTYDVVKSVLAAGSDDVGDAIARAEAVTAVRSSEDFTAISAAFKRMKNILSQAHEQGDEIDPFVGSPGATVHFAEEDLRAAANEVSVKVGGFKATKNYAGALEEIASLRPFVDRYFEQVMVMDPDPNVRRNRLALLSFILANIQGIADLSEIVVAG